MKRLFFLDVSIVISSQFEGETVHVKAKSWQSLTDKNNNKEFILSIY
jgi:hypothetical protein